MGGTGKPSDIVKGARDQADAVKKMKEDGESFVRPVVSIAPIYSWRAIDRGRDIGDRGTFANMIIVVELDR